MRALIATLFLYPSLGFSQVVNPGSAAVGTYNPNAVNQIKQPGAGVYDPQTGITVYNSPEKKAGNEAEVLNLSSGKVEKRKSSDGEKRILGIYNEATMEVEFIEANAKNRDIMALYNPATSKVESMTAKKEGTSVIGVFNDLTGKIEFRESEKPGHDIVGVFNQRLGKIVFKEAEKKGVKLTGSFNSFSGKVEFKEIDEKEKKKKTDDKNKPIQKIQFYKPKPSKK